MKIRSIATITLLAAHPLVEHAFADEDAWRPPIREAGGYPYSVDMADWVSIVAMSARYEDQVIMIDGWMKVTVTDVSAECEIYKDEESFQRGRFLTSLRLLLDDLDQDDVELLKLYHGTLVTVMAEFSEGGERWIEERSLGLLKPPFIIDIKNGEDVPEGEDELELQKLFLYGGKRFKPQKAQRDNSTIGWWERTQRAQTDRSD